MGYFVVTREPGPSWDPTRPMREQDDWKGHAAFMDELAAEGFVVLGGPIGDGSHFLFVMDADDEAKIDARLAGDPWVAADCLRTRKIEPWEILLSVSDPDGDNRATQQKPDSVSYFAVTEERGPSWDGSRARREQDGWDEHATFMDALTEEGAVVLGGPVGDGTRVLLIVDAQSEQEVNARLTPDPWIEMGILRVGAVEPWEILLEGRR